MYVLVHGATMGAGCWDRLLPYLDRPALAVDLPGRGRRGDVPITSVTLADCEQALREDLAGVEGDDLVLVAHSFAGVSVPRVMADLADRIAHVVFLSAVVPPDGTAVIDQIDPAVRDAVRASITDGVYRMDAAGAEMMLANDLDAEQTAWTVDQVVEDSAALLTETVDLSGLAAEIPRTYVHLSEDVCYPPALQERSARITGGHVEVLASGHMAMVSRPRDLAGILARVTSG